MGEMKIFKRLPAFMGVLLLGAAMTIAAVGEADARKGGGFGSRGTRTYTAPPSTNTAPSAAQPIQRSMTPAPGPQTAGAAANATRGGLFGGGFAGSLLRGLAIGGLIGLLLGQGFGGLAGFLGLLLQVGLIALVAMLAFRFFASRRQPTPAGAGAPYGMNRDGLFGGGSQPQSPDRSALGGLGGGLGGSMGRPAYQPAPNRRVRDEIGITPQDFDMFEARLSEVQDAYSREDREALRRLTTPEIFSVFAEELDQNAAHGVRNDVRDVKLLQGDLAEAWREGDTDYATVAMRYQMRDVMRDRATGALTPDSSDAPEEVTEVWTFARRRGGDWVLSAIQDA